MSTITSLSSIFTTIIDDLMEIERQPLESLQNQYDTINLRKGTYSDAKTKLSELQDAVKDLMSSAGLPALSAGRTTALSNIKSGFSVLSASASSSAATGTYQFHFTSPAQKHTIRSDQQAHADQALGLPSGSIWIGGEASRAVANPAGTGTSVTTFTEAASIADGQIELGTGKYHVETREATLADNSKQWQFRLVEGEGNAISIRQGDSSSTTFSSDWQEMKTGAYDTGRGLSITFGNSFAAASWISSAPSVDYISLGVKIDLTGDDSLNSIASKINSQTYIPGNAVSATVVDRQLVLTAAASGESHLIQASGSILESLGVIKDPGDIDSNDKDTSDNYKHTLQKASNAVFSVNDVEVTRSQNSGLSNVIGGVTLNIAPDAAEQDATLTISGSWTDARSRIDQFVEKFNSVLTYLEAKTAITGYTEAGKTTFTRGPLADDTIFGDLRGNLFNVFMSSYDTQKAFTSLRDIGLTIGDNLKASVSDPAKLEAALNTKLSDVTALLDQVMGSLNSRLSRFTGKGVENGYLDSAIKSFGNEMTSINRDIADMNTRLSTRKQFLTNQYAEMQAQLINLSYTQQMWSNIYGTTNQMM